MAVGVWAVANIPGTPKIRRQEVRKIKDRVAGWLIKALILVFKSQMHTDVRG
ncbi:hypothetical protein AVDCRST_MAG92-553 [uncultured Coleofasciculus sp.]|uniref:Uncharacterized protein n=1 Tax=uncultured Coleofasciculus sp. TaxID=1267456 RepID=A0A6J4HDS9_9CYAN|nr:hypothetical protein AVDCRST_MAG92-553 [uncultured Coleofasciculus sp.]